ncbi:hypothetical protein ES319_D06G238800v1 [Gossypium barbadense]|uniref:Uncharacterized protein n=2 Tax=Gossypium TaxID=3633 RepID=A0A5J5R6D9_GOSBA|nr:hypothetical protein ES319_D06G238800v1 [Gossypium barbadense]TYG66236.1 hypothetical protein ES288_D06G251700v1 [Gossypium darwinii]
MALSSDQTPEVAMSAFEYGKNLVCKFRKMPSRVLWHLCTSASLGKGSLSDIRQGIVTAPILFAMEEFPRLKSVIQQALEYLWKSRGIQRTKELAIKHANLVAAAIDSLPESRNIDVTKSRHALINLTRILVTRNK